MLFWKNGRRLSEIVRILFVTPAKIHAADYTTSEIFTLIISAKITAYDNSYC